jgi:3-dehydroquinate synthase
MINQQPSQRQAPHNVRVELGARSYDIYIEDDCTARACAFVRNDYAGKSIFVIADQAVNSLCADAVVAALKPDFDKVELYSVPSGEASKSVDMYGDILQWLACQGARRDSLIIAIGGGVIGDLAGFIAASYMRGVDFIQIPTTLLAQVDSSVGGKTAINIAAGKNLVGAFYQPKAVFCSSSILKSLPVREMRSGYAEIYKYGLLWDAGFMVWLHDNAARLLAHEADAVHYAVQRCCEIKAEIVAQDERESGLRALLNLGHTFAHVLETLCGYDDRLRHGEAVSIGMCLAAELSEKLGFIDAEDALTVSRHLKSLSMPTSYGDIANRPKTSVDEMVTLMYRDKKASAQGITFIVLERLGKAGCHSNVSENMLRDVLERFIENA